MINVLLNQRWWILHASNLLAVMMLSIVQMFVKDFKCYQMFVRLCLIFFLV